MKELFLKYKMAILYLFFGGVTTVINIAVYAVCSRVFYMGTISSTVVAWVLAVAVAYITNKIWVFESKTWDLKSLGQEVGSFVVCRIATGVMDLAIMYLSVDLLHWNDLLMKIISNVLVIVLNFVFSKLLIFKK